MAEEKTGESATGTPPYVPWKTFDNYLTALKATVPGRIDRSVLSNMSGATQMQLLAALRFFGFIEQNGTPTKALRDFAKLEGADRSEALRSMVADRYADLLRGADLESGSYKQLWEHFSATGLQGDTLRKAIAFYLAAAKAAGLQVSPFFVQRGAGTAFRRPRGAGRRAGRASVEMIEEDDDEEELPPPPPPPAKTRFEVLMEKFPQFDPTWSADVQTKWFDAFERIQKTAEEQG